MGDTRPRRSGWAGRLPPPSGQGVLGKEVLFPVYRLLTGPGSNARYDIIGWVGFVVTAFDPSGSSGTVTGYLRSAARSLRSGGH